MKSENFITIQGWMINQLGLKDKELLAFALVYGFCQDGTSVFTGSISYISDWLTCSSGTARTSIHKLTDKGLLIRNVNMAGSIEYITYSVNFNKINELKNRASNIEPPLQNLKPTPPNFVAPPLQNLEAPPTNFVAPPTKFVANSIVNNIEENIIENINTHNSENLQFSDVYEPLDFQNRKQSSAARHNEKLGGNDIQVLGRERAEMKKIIQSTIEQENKRYNKVWAVMYENLSKKDSDNFMELQRLFIELEPDAELRLLTFQKYLEACYEKLAKEFKPKEPQVFSISWILGVYNLVAPILKRKATEQNEKAAAAAETQEKLNQFMRMYAEPEPEPQPEKPAERRKREYYQTGEDGKVRIVTEYLD